MDKPTVRGWGNGSWGDCFEVAAGLSIAVGGVGVGRRGEGSGARVGERGEGVDESRASGVDERRASGICFVVAK